MNSEVILQEVELRPVSDYKELYERVRELGRGKYGVVYEVKSKSTQNTYAAKHVRARRQDVRDKVRIEISLLQRLHHPHIIHLEDSFENAAEMVLLTEFLSGGELFERVASEEFNLTEAECVQFVRQICEGVKYIHEQNIVHLDLKPENIVCCQPDSTEVKIIDFGLAREIHEGDQVKVMCGTAEFISPEIINYDPVSSASDMWSLGVIAYVLLSGLSPFMGDNVGETYSNVCRVEYDFEDPEFDEISAEAKDFISKLLLKNPQQRMTAKQCLLHPWLKRKSEVELNLPSKRINTTNLRKFLARRRWHKCGQAIRAMKRMSGLMIRRRSSTQSYDEDDSSSNSSELNSPIGDINKIITVPKSPDRSKAASPAFSADENISEQGDIKSDTSGSSEIHVNIKKANKNQNQTLVESKVTNHVFKPSTLSVLSPTKEEDESGVELETEAKLSSESSVKSSHLELNLDLPKSAADSSQRSMDMELESSHSGIRLTVTNEDNESGLAIETEKNILDIPTTNSSHLEIQLTPKNEKLSQNLDEEETFNEHSSIAKLKPSTKSSHLEIEIKTSRKNLEQKVRTESVIKRCAVSKMVNDIESRILNEKGSTAKENQELYKTQMTLKIDGN